MRGLDALIIGRQDHLAIEAIVPLLAGREQSPAFLFGILEMAEQKLGIGSFEIVSRIFLLGLQKDVAIGDFPSAPSRPLKLRS